MASDTDPAPSARIEPEASAYPAGPPPEATAEARDRALDRLRRTERFGRRTGMFIVQLGLFGYVVFATLLGLLGPAASCATACRTRRAAR